MKMEKLNLDELDVISEGNENLSGFFCWGLICGGACAGLICVF